MYFVKWCFVDFHYLNSSNYFIYLVNIMNNQKSLLISAFNDWLTGNDNVQGSFKQVDDVCIVDLKI